MLPQRSDHGSGLCWVDLTLHSESPPSRESEEEKVDLISRNVLKNIKQISMHTKLGSLFQIWGVIKIHKTSVSRAQFYYLQCLDLGECQINNLS